MELLGLNTYDSPGENGNELVNRKQETLDLEPFFEELQELWVQDIPVKVASPMKLVRGPDTEEISRKSLRYRFSSCFTFMCCHQKIADYVSMVSSHVKFQS